MKCCSLDNGLNLPPKDTFLRGELLQSCLFSRAYTLCVCTKPQKKSSHCVPVRSTICPWKSCRVHMKRVLCHGDLSCNSHILVLITEPKFQGIILSYKCTKVVSKFLEVSMFLMVVRLTCKCRTINILKYDLEKWVHYVLNINHVRKIHVFSKIIQYPQVLDIQNSTRKDINAPKNLDLFLIEVTCQLSDRK